MPGSSCRCLDELRVFVLRPRRGYRDCEELTIGQVAELLHQWSSDSQSLWTGANVLGLSHFSSQGTEPVVSWEEKIVLIQRLPRPTKKRLVTDLGFRPRFQFRVRTDVQNFNSCGSLGRHRQEPVLRQTSMYRGAQQHLRE